MKRCSALLQKKENRKKKAAHVKKVMLDTLEDYDADLAASFDIIGKRRKISTPAINGSTEVASTVSMASSHGENRSLYQASLFDCTPMMNSRSKDDIVVDETASPHGPSNTAAKISASRADLIRVEGLNVDLSKKARFQYMICAAKVVTII
jgi:hypothetical protein